MAICHCPFVCPQHRLTGCHLAEELETAKILMGRCNWGCVHHCTHKKQKQVTFRKLRHTQHKMNIDLKGVAIRLCVNTHYANLQMKLTPHYSYWDALSHAHICPAVTERRDVTQPWPHTQWGRAGSYVFSGQRCWVSFKCHLWWKQEPPPHTSLYHWIWIVPCGYTPTACGDLLSPITLEWQVAGHLRWSTTSPTWRTSSLSPPITLINFTRRTSTESNPRRFFRRLTNFLLKLLHCHLFWQQLHMHLPASLWVSHQDRQLGEWGLMNAPLDR